MLDDREFVRALDQHVPEGRWRLTPRMIHISLRGWPVLSTILTLAACHIDQVHRHYATYREATEAGERTHGWLPDWVPASAVDIHIQGDIDTNERWLRFDVVRSVADSLRQELVPLSADSMRGRAPSRSNAWWFEGLNQRRPTNDVALNAELYRGNSRRVARSVMIAFERASQHVYVWSGADGVIP